MKHRSGLALAVLALATLACGVVSGGGAASGGVPSPTPPAIPTKPADTLIGPSDLSPTPSPTVPPEQTAAIVFGTARDGRLDIYFLTADGRFAAPLYLDAAVVRNAVWPDISPSGERIAFASVQSSLLPNGLFVANIDGSSPLQITGGDGDHPCWSPDGTRIAYSCNGETDICVISPDGSNQVNVTVDSDTTEMYPVWTPDGRIVFMSNRDVAASKMFSEIYIMNADGSGVTRLTNDNDAYNAYPSVSPDGQRIAFESNRDTGGGKSDLYVMDSDGGNLVRVTTDAAWNQNPRWSPDGTRLLFAANYGDGNIDLYQINLDGSNRVRLTEHLADDGGLRSGHAWILTPLAAEGWEQERDATPVRPPSGSQAVSNAILFATNSFNCPDCLETGIYAINFDGSNLFRLPVEGLYPAWAPDFERYAFVQNGELFIADADSSNVIQMTQAYYGLGSLDWHTEGEQILADCTPYGQHDVCLIDAESGAINNISDLITFGSGVPFPYWISPERIGAGPVVLSLTGDQLGTLPFTGRVSPDGETLAAIIKRQLVTMDLGGGNQVQLTSDAPTKGFPIWSPDGQLLVYTVAPGDGYLYLYIVQTTGENPRQLVARPIAPGPTGRADSISTWLGYSWAP